MRRMLGVQGAAPIFGWRARVPLANGRMDRTEVDMRWGGLLVEAKLTEADFQTRTAAVVEAYRDFDAVFDREMLPRVAVPVGRRRMAEEFPEDYSQEGESLVDRTAETASWIAAEVAPDRRQVEARYAGYQLIRNVLAAYAEGASFCVIHDERRPDLREAWFQVMAAVKLAEMRVRCQVLTWQEVAGLAPAGLREFLAFKYGIEG